MEDLFGVKMDWIMYVLLALFVPSLAFICILAARNRVMLKMGLRNISRRKAQTALIIVGIMISTLIMSASFGTGDTLTFSIKKAVVDGLGTIDEFVLSARPGETDRFGGAAYIPVERFEAMQRELADFDSIDGLAAGLAETAPAVNERTSRSEGGMQIAGVNPATLQGFGGFRLGDGSDVRVEDLAQDEIFINSSAAEDLEAVIGDTLTVYVYGDPVSLSVKGVVEGGGPVGSQPTLLLNLSAAQRMFGREGQINSIVVSNTGDEYGGAGLSDEVTGKLRILFADRQVASDLRSVLSRPEVLLELERKELDPRTGEETRQDLSRLRAALSGTVLSDDLISMLSDDELQAEYLDAVAATGDEQLSREASTLVVSMAEFVVIDIKRSLLDTAEQVGSLVTTFFILFGLFSIMVGILLIFLIFVMLAAARRSELGMARAVGARRWHLVQMFVFEGTAYSLLSGVVGVGLGLLASALIVGIINQIFAGGGTGGGPDDFRLTRHFELRSAVVAYCLGMVITFLTVAISAYRVSRLNIVAAIRDLPSPQETTSANALQLLARLIMSGLLLLPLQVCYSGLRALAGRRFRRGVLLVLVAPLSVLAAPLVFVYTLFQLLLSPFRQGWMVVIRVCLSTIVVGVGLLITWLGTETDMAMWVRLGLSISIIGLGLLLRSLLNVNRVRPERSDRIAYTFIGVLILAYWFVPFSTLQAVFGELNAGFEMFFISGVTMVAAAVWTVMYNADLLLKLLSLSTSRVGRLRPVLVTAVAYPMSARFRTGITLAMFALVIFTMMVMSILTETFSTTAMDPEDLLGGWDVSARVNPSTPISDISQAIDADPNLDLADFDTLGGYTFIPLQARQRGAEEQTWRSYAVRAADDSYLEGTDTEFHLIADGYGTTAQEVWDALQEDSTLVVVDALAVPTRAGFQGGENVPEFQLEGVFYEDQAFQPVSIDVREPRSGTEMQLTVIAILDETSDAFGLLGGGMIASRRQLDDISPFPIPVTNYRFKLAEGVDHGEVSRDLEFAFQRNGLESSVLAEEVEESLSANQSFNYLLTGFMGLGLMVGVASLGVVSLRAVVERRQQIGVLRAIGYRRGMIQLTFLIESSFVVLLGVAIGVGLGTAISYLIVREIREDVETIRFTFPWVQILIIVVVAYLFSLVTTLLPARQAGGVYPAEALRYE